MDVDGADEAGGRAALMIAAFEGHAEFVRVLLQVATPPPPSLFQAPVVFVRGRTAPFPGVPARSSYHLGENLSLLSEGAADVSINDCSREDRNLQAEGLLNNRTLPQPSQSRVWCTPRINTGCSQPAEGSITEPAGRAAQHGAHLRFELPRAAPAAGPTLLF